MFKSPSTLPQDLLLIHELVSTIPTSFQNSLQDERAPIPSDSDTEASSNARESDTETEEVNLVEKLLVTGEAATAEKERTARSPSPTSSESSSSSSESDIDRDSDAGQDKSAYRGVKSRKLDIDQDEDEEDGMQPGAGPVLRTKNEIEETAIKVPEIVEIGADEVLEKIGEVMSVIDNLVIIKGLPSDIQSRASERALDSESLLVFEDRKVLGYVHETFGPTSQPFYQVKFPNTDSIDKSAVTVPREVFHSPGRSNFIFASQLKAMKGSDASNVHDEEVNEDEIEFSDDEAEATYKRQRREQREARRGSSVASSRFATPALKDEREYSSFYDASPYDEYGPYDMDNAPGPSRPPPLPYDDPYEDIPPPVLNESKPARPITTALSATSRNGPERYANRGRGHGRGRERGRGRGRSREDRPRQGQFGHGDAYRRQSSNLNSNQSYGQRERLDSVCNNNGGYQPSSSPISSSSSHAPGQVTTGVNFSAGQHHYNAVQSPTGYQQSFSAQGFHPPQQSFVQPHINPRFASMFGIDLNSMQTQQYTPLQQPAQQNLAPYNSYQNTTWNGDGWSQPNSSTVGSGRTGHTEDYTVPISKSPDNVHPQHEK